MIFEQSLGINNTNPDADAVLDIVTTDKGILILRVITVQRTSIGGGNPAAGMLVYDTKFKSFWYYDGTDWKELSDVQLELSSKRAVVKCVFGVSV